ncbi:hypothetical protein PVAP13_3NG103001 [Panicum virgatum]|uniref:No apical meristem-associated C-terminal domain-containing protein n=2 Tax=Panicum virgatum TaxID=38727 RepID=A0A8T0U5X0_PANVG|nr:hypothetical protein PVAP13_3NG103001 [Panicum virgatum]
MSHPNANVNADNGGAARTDKRIIWSVDEDSRLMSAWLKCSLDPVQGNDRRKEQYWNDVIDTYNLTTPSVRRRTLKQAKDRWHKINKLSDLFHNAYLKAQRIYTSSFNEEKWIAEAQRFYEADNSELKLGRFTLMDVWYLIRNEPKWKTYNDGLKDARKRKTSHQAADEVSDEAEDMDRDDNPRPPGQKATKKALFESKGKVAEANLADDEEMQFLKEAQANRMKVLEMQQKLSAERLESSRLSSCSKGTQRGQESRRKS